MTDSLLARLATALAIGLVVGVERGWQFRDEPDGARVAGIRTYALSGLLGGVAVAIAQALESPLVFAAGLLAFTAIAGVFQLRDAAQRGTVSATAAIAAIAVFALGALAVLGETLAAGAAGVAMAGVLASREVLHNLLRKLTWIELRSALLLLAMTLIVLPLLPNRTIDPWGGVNPWQVWFFTVLIAAVSYAGYVTVRLMGPSRGLAATALIGAIVSSTAVTVAFGRRAKAGEPWQPLAGGAALAAMVSVLRVVIIVAVANPALVVEMVVPATAAAFTFGASGALMLWRTRTITAGADHLGNPIDFAALLLFGVVFVVVGAASAALTGSLGAGGLTLTSAFAGVFNIDVAALTTSQLAGSAVPLADGARAVLLALAFNAGGRLVAAVAMGPVRYWLFLAGASALAILVGAVAAVLVGLL